MKENGRFLKQYRGTKCLNCGVPLDVIDKYCHNCGQINTTKKLSLKDFFGEFFASIWSYDSRLAHTITALLFKPGKISKDYIEGKRVTYANPFRFYLSVSILFFIIFGFYANFSNFSSEFNEGWNKRSKNTETKKKDTEFSKSPLNKKTKEEVYFSESQLDTTSAFKAIKKRLKTYRSYYKKTKEKSTKTALDSLHHKNTTYNRYLYNRTVKIEELEKSPSALFKFIFDRLPLIIFFFLPFLAIGIWLLYIRGSFTYMEHLVFTFHTQTMLFIFLGIGILINQIFKSEIPIGIAILIFLFYLYKAMSKFYMQKRFKTIVKFLLVNILFFILASIGSTTTIFGSIFLF